MILPQPPLLVVTDRRQAKRPLDAILDEAFAAGCRWASIREKYLRPAEQVILLRNLLPLARNYRATLTLHGDPTLALEAGAHGVHLAAGSDAKAARALLGRAALIGISIHSLTDAAVLDPEILDYAIAGPIFETMSKPGYGPGLGVKGLRVIRDESRVPIVAIGGITSGSIVDIRRSGVDGIAVMGGLMRADDVGGQMEELLAALCGV